MKKILLILTITISAFNTTAQKNKDNKIGLNIGAELALATGNLNTAYSIGLGATANLEYQVNDKTTALINSGIIQFIGKKVPGTSLKIRNSASIPVLGGVKYALTENFYGQAVLGFTIFSGAGGFSRFTYAPGLGFKANDKVDILLKYTGFANSGGAFGVRVSYSLQ